MPLAEPRSAVAARLTKPVAIAWAKKVPTPTSASPAITQARAGASSIGSPAPASVSAPHIVRRVPCRCTMPPASGVVRIEGRKTK